MSGIGAVTPVNSTQIASPVANRAQREGLWRAEQEVMRQEMALRTSGEVTSVVYSYSMGPDGKRYITGATVMVRTSEVEAASGGIPPNDGSSSGEKTTARKIDATKEAEEKKNGENRETAAAKAEMKSIEREVISHEAAHKAVGGQLTGPVSYTYATGPNGERYITGGEVPITAPEGSTPEETIEIMDQVKRAALAPGSPSPQDIRVAAAASAAQMRARAEMAKQEAEKAYSDNNNLRFFPEKDSFSMTA